MNTELVPPEPDKEVLRKRRSWYILVLILILLGVATRQPMVFILALFTLLIAFVPNLWYRYGLRHIAITQHINQKRLFFGEVVTLTISVENRKLLPMPSLNIEDVITPALTVLKKQRKQLRRVSQDMIASAWLLWPLQRVTRHYRIRCLSRGLHTFGPIHLSSSDPFGWLEADTELPISEPLIIYPLVAPLETLGFTSQHPFGDYTTRRRLLEDPLQVAGVRDYQLGDEPRRIHWKETAHMGILQSKVYEPSSMRRLLVVLDVWNYSSDWRGTNLDLQEYAITVAASLAIWGLDEGYSVGALTNSAIAIPPTAQNVPLSQGAKMLEMLEMKFDVAAGGVSLSGTSIPYSRDFGQYEHILSTFAQLAPRSTASIGYLLENEEDMFPVGTTIVLVSATQTLTEDTIERLEELRYRGAVVYLVLLGHKDEKTPFETFNLPIYYLGGSEKWHELVATIGTEDTSAPGTSTTALELD